MQKKLRHFTHTDLDGVSCSAIAKLYVIVEKMMEYSPEDYTDVTKAEYEAEYMEYFTINEKVNRWIDERRYESENLLITDISINEETAERLDQIIKEDSNRKIVLLDHHQTAEFLNKYDWATVEVSDDTCGTKLTKEYLFNEGVPVLESFVHAVTQYDNYKHDKDYLSLPKILNHLCYLVDHEMFMDIVDDILIMQDRDEFSIDNKILYNAIENKETKNNLYAERKANEVIIVKDGDYNVGVVFAENNLSLVGNKIIENYCGAIDYAAIINMSNKTVHLRGGDRSPNLGLEIAKPRGGGGHAKAASYRIDMNDEFTTTLINRLLKGE